MTGGRILAASLLVRALAVPASLAQAPPPGPPDTSSATDAPDPAATTPATETETTATAKKKESGRRPNRAVPIDLDVIALKVARYPDNPYLLNELGNQYLKIGRRLEAEQRYKEAVDSDPEFAAAWNNLGVVRAALQKPMGSEEAYRRALKIQPNYALAWYNLGSNLDSQRRYEEAVKAYEKAFVLDRSLLDVKKNPIVTANKLTAWVAAQTYIDRGGTVLFPIESSYPK